MKANGAPQQDIDPAVRTLNEKNYWGPVKRAGSHQVHPNGTFSYQRKALCNQTWSACLLTTFGASKWSSIALLMAVPKLGLTLILFVLEAIGLEKWTKNRPEHYDGSFLREMCQNFGIILPKKMCHLHDNCKQWKTTSAEQLGHTPVTYEGLLWSARWLLRFDA